MRIESLSIADLNPALYNPRTITDEALKGKTKARINFH